ncbi:glutaredoxin domain-containing cysteine-rich protein CG12206-like [Cylas formicarius]|uniref:glutaredoxin domain-containing cysteine-rich protein CG12206-like n=1 Tax=Cylas formicarius TaxID=197179 RepID=UPI002958B69C|nr:glutaredoxin domain-containing cysteine-rich protein CG12206-like [Cylas formicarius]
MKGNMDDETAFVAVTPPPLPLKTKAARSGNANEKLTRSISGSCSPLQESSSSSSTTAARTTVNLNSVDFHIPTSFEELSSRGTKNKPHVVKILINPDETRLLRDDEEEESRRVVIGDVSRSPCIRISVNANNNPEYTNHGNNMVDAVVGRSSPYYFFNQFSGVMSSGQVSPSDTLDSGTCSDLDGTPPPLPKKKGGSSVSVTVIGTHKKTKSLSSATEIDTDDTESNSSSISCDSLNSGKLSPLANKSALRLSKDKTSILPQTLLQDIRERNHVKDPCNGNHIVDEKSYEDRQKESKIELCTEPINPDMFYKFHLNEKDPSDIVVPLNSVVEDETFAGYKDFLDDGAATIRSARGTVRGVKNRVRAGIATFLQINTTGKNYKEKDAGKVVVYTTTMGIIRETYQACTKVKQIMRTHLVKFEERDVFMSTEYQTEIRERMQCDHILVPQVYVDGQHIGDVETIERLNESGELRKLLKPYRSPDACSTCQVCGGYRLLPCHVCNGSKKSVHRNHFTTEFVALKCMSCDEAGLIKCTACT